MSQTIESPNVGSSDEDSSYSLFSPRQRATIIGIVCMADTIGFLSSLMYAPALPAIAESLGVSVAKIDLTITTYLIFQAITPSIWGALADVYGRRLMCCITLFITLGSAVGLALSANYPAMLVLRALSATGSASMQSLGSGIIRDIIPPRYRGGYIGWYNAGVGVAVAFGPVLGGLLTQYTSWHGIFYFLLAWSSFVALFIFFLLPETLHSVVGNGAVPPPTYLRPPIPWLCPKISSEDKITPPSLPPRQRLNLLGPLLILRWPDVVCSLIFVGVFYAIWSNHIVATSTLYASTYGLSEASIGLAYLASGFGGLFGSIVIGRILNHDYEHQLRIDFPGIDHSTKNENSRVNRVERARLRSVWYNAPLFLAGIIAFGWTIDKHVHISVSIIAMFFIGWFDVCIIAAYSALMVDLFEDNASMASASVNIVSRLLGAVGTATIQPMQNALGTGWTFTTLTLIGAALMPILWFQLRYGVKYRTLREERRSRSDTTKHTSDVEKAVKPDLGNTIATDGSKLDASKSGEQSSSDKEDVKDSKVDVTEVAVESS